MPPVELVPSAQVDSSFWVTRTLLMPPLATSRGPITGTGCSVWVAFPSGKCFQMLTAGGHQGRPGVPQSHTEAFVLQL